jgi:indole-3-pyruvate monooxygenase
LAARTDRSAPVVIVGASMAGLAMAACLQKKKLDCIILEKERMIATPWRRHYDRLHLHTPKNLSSLPFRKFGKDIPRYPSRQQVVDYLEDYRRLLNIEPLFETTVLSTKKTGDYWITETNQGNFKSEYLVIATGAFGQPRLPRFPGMETFPGKILHSQAYRTGRDFSGQKVLVVGFGNSACEIAVDLCEQGAMASMAVRSAVNVVARDFLKIPILRLSILMSRWPLRLADGVERPLMRWLLGDIRKLGLQRKPYGVFTQFRKEGTAPVLDLGTLQLIRKGCIRIKGDLDHIEGRTIHFADGQQEDFDALVAAIGYERNCAEFLQVDNERFDDLRLPIGRQVFFGRDGLYFCGFWVGPTGQIREIARDAKKIAKDISRRIAKSSNLPN